MANQENQELISGMQESSKEPAAPAKPKMTLMERAKANPWVSIPLVAVIVGGAVFGVLFYLISTSQVYIEDSNITAPSIVLGPNAPGVLQRIDVKEGDMVQANETVAQVGNELVKTKVAGQVIGVMNTIGQLVNPGSAVVTMIDPTQMRVVGQIEEDKGLSSVHVGQTAVFTVDAFGSKKFAGVVDEIVPTAVASDVVFNISDTREEQDFYVKVRYNTSEYTQFINGMSARIWVFK
jgi:multidrug resistance efflux pump